MTSAVPSSLSPATEHDTMSAGIKRHGHSSRGSTRVSGEAAGARETDTETRARMATLVQPADMETLGGRSDTGASPTSPSPPQRFNDGRFYLLVVVGEVATDDHLKCAIADIERGKAEIVTPSQHRELRRVAFGVLGPLRLCAPRTFTRADDSH